MTPFFERINMINELYNCSLAQADLTSSDGQANLTKTVSSGDDAYQIALIRSCQYSGLLTKHVMLELENVPYVDLSQPWFDSNSSEALALIGRNFGIVSNITMNCYKLAFCAYFNQVLADNLQLENMFDFVEEGKWTWDAMFTMGELAVQDLDGDGKPTTKDCYGITYIEDVPEGLLNAGGVRYASLNSEGIPEITITTEENITKMQWLLSKFQDQNLSINLHRRSNQTQIDEVGMFMNRQSLFSLAGIYYAPQFRDMEDNLASSLSRNMTRVRNTEHLCSEMYFLSRLYRSPTPILKTQV